MAGVRHLPVMLVANISLHHGHAVGGQRARLVGADGRSIAHGLAGIQVTHQVVVLHHFLGEGRKRGGVRGQDEVAKAVRKHQAGCYP